MLIEMHLAHELRMCSPVAPNLNLFIFHCFNQNVISSVLLNNLTNGGNDMKQTTDLGRLAFVAGY